MQTADSSAKNCFFRRHVPPQPASLLPLLAPTHPIPQGPIKVEDPSVHQCPFFPNWNLKNDLKTEEVHEEPLEAEVREGAGINCTVSNGGRVVCTIEEVGGVDYAVGEVGGVEVDQARSQGGGRL